MLTLLDLAGQLRHPDPEAAPRAVRGGRLAESGRPGVHASTGARGDARRVARPSARDVVHRGGGPDHVSPPCARPTTCWSSRRAVPRAASASSSRPGSAAIDRPDPDRRRHRARKGRQPCPSASWTRDGAKPAATWPRRCESLDGRTVGLLDNGKTNGAPARRDRGDAARAARRPRVIRRRRSPTRAGRAARREGAVRRATPSSPPRRLRELLVVQSARRHLGRADGASRPRRSSPIASPRRRARWPGSRVAGLPVRRHRAPDRAQFAGGPSRPGGGSAPADLPIWLER